MPTFVVIALVFACWLTLATLLAVVIGRMADEDRAARQREEQEREGSPPARGRQQVLGATEPYHTALMTVRGGPTARLDDREA